MKWRNISIGHDCVSQLNTPVGVFHILPKDGVYRVSKDAYIIKHLDSREDAKQFVRQEINRIVKEMRDFMLEFDG